MPDFSIEASCNGTVCGIDEAGRGPLAGPVVAAAVILDQNHIPQGVDDCKKLKPAQREALFAQITKTARYGIGMASVEEIDTINILRASLLAMSRAYEALGEAAQVALIDGNHAPTLPCATRCVIKGDSLSYSIAAASIIAKVTRDRMMQELARIHPEYGFERHAGYGTAAHLAAIEQYGITPHHRRSFTPIKQKVAA